MRAIAIDKGRSGYRLLFMAAGALMLANCTSGGDRPPVDERSRAASAGDRYAGSSGVTRVSGGAQVAESDWTARVRPLGNSGPSTTRALPGDAIGEPAAGAGTVAQSGATPLPVASGGTSTKVNPAVVTLLNTARAQSRAGDHARAAATLERAIAIEPDNAWLWHRLADTRLNEGRLEQAAGLAAKSSSLPSADRRLQADNWKIIAEVHRRQGDARAAAAAEAQARKLSN